MSWIKFFTLNVSGRQIDVLKISETNFASLYAGAFRQLITGSMGSIWFENFGETFHIKGLGCKFMYFHFMLLGMIEAHEFVVFRTSDWNRLVGLIGSTWKWLMFMK
jgi:hypothetical protein